MHQRISIITLGVNNLEESVTFYQETLGWKPAPNTTDEIAFFQLNGIVFGLFEKSLLAEDALQKNDGFGFPGFTLAYNTHSEEEVDSIIQELRTKNVEIVKEPQKVFWGGYSSYFKDPNGYLWEVAYNPYFKFDSHGNLDLNS